MEDIVKIFATNLNRLMDDRGENLTQLSNRIGVAYSTVSDWQHGRKMPRSGSLQKLADHFGVNITYLTSNDSGSSENQPVVLIDGDRLYNGKPINDHEKDMIKALLDAYRKGDD